MIPSKWSTLQTMITKLHNLEENNTKEPRQFTGIHYLPKGTFQCEIYEARPKMRIRLAVDRRIRDAKLATLHLGGKQRVDRARKNRFEAAVLSSNK